jgi:tRNA (cmo5U34)-methyltransferase
MCHRVFAVDASTNHATFPRARKLRKSPSVKRFTRLEVENYPLDLEKRLSFILSSLAIHHLVMAEKVALFEYVHHHLDPGGFFLNIDVVLSPTNDLEEWYLVLWKEWIDSHVANLQKASLLPVPQKYKDNVDNTPDLLLPQLKALERIGFRNVDCYYKYGIFAMFGGSKAE